MTALSRAFFLLCFLFVIAVSGREASAQSREETQAFITEKGKNLVYDSYYNGKHFARTETSLIFAKDGTLVRTEKITDMEGGRYVETYTDEIVLKTLNPKRVTGEKTKAFMVYMYTTGDKEMIKRTITSNNPKNEPTRNVTVERSHISTNDERVGNQLVKAIRHLIELEGGKPELFEE